MRAFAQERPNALEVHIMRPAFVTKKDSSFIVGALWTLLPSIKVDVLALAMNGIALYGADKQIFENADLVSKGNEYLLRQ